MPFKFVRSVPARMVILELREPRSGTTETIPCATMAEAVAFADAEPALEARVLGREYGTGRLKVTRLR